MDLKTSQKEWSTPEGSTQAKSTNPETDGCCQRGSVLSPNETSQQMDRAHKEFAGENDLHGGEYVPSVTRGDIGVNPKTSQQLRGEHKKLDSMH